MTKKPLILIVIVICIFLFGPVILPPKIFVSFPGENSKEVPLDSRIEVIFDRGMLKPTVERSITVSPSVVGSVSWEGDQKVVFTPGKNFERGKTYTLSISGIPLSKYLIPLLGSRSVTFETIGNPKVILNAPQTEAQEASSLITVIFDRPMIALTTAKNTVIKVPAFTVSPELPGEGRWLGTTAYQLQPSVPYALATTYTVTVAGGIKSQDGGVMADDFSWQFSSERPRVAAVSPAALYQYASPVASVSATFTQPIDAKTVTDKFVLQDSKGNVVSGSTRVSGNQVGFYAVSPLHRGEKYSMTVKKGIGSTKGPNGTESDYPWSFTVGALPAVLSTDPRTDTKDVSEQYDIRVQFATPMKDTSFDGNVVITPAPDSKPSFSFWNGSGSNNTLHIGTYLSRSTHYSITIGTAVTDEYGVPLSQPFTFSFDTAPYKPSINISPANTYFASFNQEVIPRIVSQVVNAQKVDYTLYSLKRDDVLDLYRRHFLQGCGNNNESCRSWQSYDPSKLTKLKNWTETYQSDLNTPVSVVTKVTDAHDGLLAPGFYFLDARIPQGVHDNLVMIVTKSALTVKKSDNQIFVWSVSQSSGDVVSGMKVQLTDSTGSVKAEGTTNSNGVFMADVNLLHANNLFVFGTKNDDLVVASDSWSNGIDRSDFGLPYYYSTSDAADYLKKVEHKLFFTLDRPIYRPGQKVYFKGVVRKDTDGAYASVPAGSTAKVTFDDARGRNVYTEELPLTTYGSVSGLFDLSKDANLGSYTTTITYQNAKYSQSFQVEEYKKPDISMDVTTDKKAYVTGETATITIHAAYYFGAPLINAPVTWTINRQGYSFRWEKDWRYEFGDPDADWSLPWWYFEGPQYFSGEKVTQGSGVTNSKGDLVIQVPLDISRQSVSQQMVIEAGVDDINNQAIASSQQFIVHKASVYAGLHPVSYVNQSGKEVQLEVQSVNDAGSMVPNVPVSLEFFKRTWDTVREQNPDDGQFYFTSKPHDKSVQTVSVTTDTLGHAVASFTPSDGGTYKVVAQVVDASGRLNRSGSFVWVSGYGYEAPRENNDRITLVTDKRDYTVGENMSVFVASPYASESAKTLLTVERGSVLSYKVTDTSDASNNFSLPIATAFTPNAYVGAVLVRGGNQVKKPAEFKMGYSEIRVTNSAAQIQVSVTTDKPRYAPRDTMTATIRTTDLTGKPVAAEVAVGLVDKAVWDLSQVEFPDIYKIFYEPRNLGVSTSQLLTISMDRINANTNLGSKGGSGGGCFTGDTPILMAGNVYKRIADIHTGDTVLTRESPTSPTLKEGKVSKTFKHIIDTYLILNGTLKVTPVHKMYVNGTWKVAGEIRVGDTLLDKNNHFVPVTSIDRATGIFAVYNLSVDTYHTFIAGDIYVHNDKGGFDTARTNFPDTAYWNPNLMTDQNGFAQIKITLPDSLTTWRVGALANNVTSAFGSSVSTVVVSRDVLIRPFLPRFLSYGDQATLGAIISNTSGQDKDLTTTIAADGLTITGVPSMTQHVPDGGQVKFVWPTTALQKDATKITLTVSGSDGATLDKMETTLPIKTYSVPEVVATSGLAKDTAQERILLPKTVDPALGKAAVSVSPSLGAGSIEAFNYLFMYPYYCSEQITSRLLPAASLYRILTALKLDQLGSVKKSELKSVIEDAIQRLNNQQHPDGGWGWWSDFDTDPYMSAYAYMGLLAAKNANITVASQTLSRAESYLLIQMDFASGRGGLSLDTQAFILYTLQGKNNVVSPYAANLYERRFELTLESRAYLALAMKNISGMGARADRIMQELTGLAKKTATTTHWEEQRNTYQFMGSNTTTTAGILQALIAFNPKSPLIPEVIRYLMTIRHDQHWWNTRDTAAVVTAIASQLVSQGDDGLKEQYKVDLNTKSIANDTFAAKDLLSVKTYTIPVTKLLLGVENLLQITKSGTGNLYYNIDLTYYLPFASVEPLEQGITMLRDLTDDAGHVLPSDSIDAGSEAWERLTIVVPADRHFVAIEDILPAGLESVNESLKNVAVLNKLPPKITDKNTQQLYFNHKEYYDDRTTFFATYLSAGVYEVAYRVRATTPGKFHRPPASAYEMYVPDVSGHSDGGWFEVK